MSISLTPGSRYGVVLDTCVLVGFPLCDTLLRLAERQFFRPYWTRTILDELERTLTEKLKLSEASARRRIGHMTTAFPEAMVRNIPEMQVGLPDTDDEHILVTAISSEAQAIVTLNLKHFPVEICSRHHVEVIHPDDFLVSQFDLNPQDARNVIYSQVGDTESPAYGVADLMRRLEPQTPAFVSKVKNAITLDVSEFSEN